MTTVPNLYTHIDSEFSPSKFSKKSGRSTGRSTSSSIDFDTIPNNNQVQSTLMTNNLLKETVTSKARRKSANAALTKRGHSSSSFSTLPNIGNEKEKEHIAARKFENKNDRERSTVSSSSSASAYDKVDDNVFHAALQELNQIKQEYRGSGSVGVKNGTRGDSSESERQTSPAASTILVPCPPYPSISSLTRRSNSSTSRNSDSTNYSPSGDQFHHSFAAGSTGTKDFENSMSCTEEVSSEINALREERDRATSKLKVAEKVMRQLYHKSKELQEAADSCAKPPSKIEINKTKSLTR